MSGAIPCLHLFWTLTVSEVLLKNFFFIFRSWFMFICIHDCINGSRSEPKSYYRVWPVQKQHLFLLFRPLPLVVIVYPLI